MEKKLIGVKFIASTLQVRKDNGEICSILWSKDEKIGKKIYIKDRYCWCDFFSFVSPSGHFTGHLHFWLQKFKCWIGKSYLQEKTLPLLFLETLWSFHGESGKRNFERTVTLMGIWPKTNVYYIERGIYRVDRLKRNSIGTIWLTVWIHPYRFSFGRE